MKITQKITPCLWFNNQAEEAADFYVSVFNGAPGEKTKSHVTGITHYDKASAEVSGMPEGSVLTVSFNLADMDFLVLNGGTPPKENGNFTFTPATSFVINCANQAEVDWFWEKLSADGGRTSQCGWLTDKYGVTWQVVPVILGELLSSSDTEKAKRVMRVMLQMTKLNIAELENA